jgi:hypothetical protein
MRFIRTIVPVSGFGLVLAASPVLAQLSIVPSSATFRDIRSTGVSLAGIADDSENAITAAQLASAGFGGNSVFAGGVDILVGNNGAIVWNPSVDTTQIGYTNAALVPAPAASNTTINGNGNGQRQFLAVQWDDLLPSSSLPATSIYWQVISGDLLVQWTDQDNFNATGSGRITFQAVIYGAPVNGVVGSYVYADTLYDSGISFNDGGGATIGYLGNGVGVAPNSAQWSFNTGSIAGSVSNGGVVAPAALDLVVVPAPGAATLAGLGLLAVGARRRR